jgi:hypothetical protein
MKINFERKRIIMFDFTPSKAIDQIKIEWDNVQPEELKRHEQLALYLFGEISYGKLKELWGLKGEYLNSFDQNLFDLMESYIMKRR